MTTPWDPKQYLKFQSERFAPFDDLLVLVPRRPGMSVVDLGCGTGDLTQRLAEELPDSNVLGVDSSESMLEAAGVKSGPRLEFRLQRIEDVDGQWDLVFSNAALQWLDDHETLIPRVFAMVAPGGRLAIQIPSNADHPSQTLLAETAAEHPMSDAFRDWPQRVSALGIRRYAEILVEQGATQIVALDKVYPHVLEDSDAVAEWMAGTAVRPYLDRLPPHLHSEFEKRYREKLGKAMPGTPVFFGFKRTLLAGTKAE